MEESGLDKLKQGYEILKNKYNLPSFDEMNKLFEIEELCDCETDFLIRRIRRTISERVSGHLRFVETLLNPSNAPIFFFKLIKKLDSDDKEKLNNILEELGMFEIDLVKLDLEFNEEKEAEFVNNIFNRFSEIKKQLLEIVDKLENGDNKKEDNERSYFG
ncbi:MAG: hypothetical protein WC438_03695 [Candidatus Pacearchaeota archaeon]